ncbi:protein enabled isoform X4 [Acyrthosiphon pisum]|uniref:WH1 domain-containing protein n=1 Tax=Acyrthosiphon pisum TaxID=7029 RepID=A0A8R2H7U1_ACYPI|nr:protein enabled isoform X4 [Acyrthosiphon pisum]|eukprot:XP_016663930.1 PREDICTED: protein enabled isoform X4 [Acyrthosiphon pisum]
MMSVASPTSTDIRETSITSARASVMIYDDNSKKWVPSGTSSGLSKVHIFKHVINNTFRVVGRKLQDHEVVINCVILKTLKYNQATTTFHQWRDNKHVYGLNFSSKEDADSFARAMVYALEVLDSVSRNNINNPHNHIPPPAPPIYQQANGQYDEDMGYRSMTKDDAAIIQERRMSQQNQIVSATNGLPTIPPAPPQLPSSGHHRTSSAPPAPVPPPPPPGMSSPLPPQPPPMPGSLPRPSSNGEADHTESVADQTSSLAIQLQAARLKRTNKQHPAENSGSSTSSASSGGSGNYGTLGRNANGGQTGMASMMDEMARTLARRRAAVEKKEPIDCPQDESVSPGDKKNWNRNDSQKSSLNGCESPKLGRKQLSATSTEDLIASKSFGDNCISNISLELQTLRQDILREIRKELNLMKLDIIESVKSEISKR